jgi:hypothetical protein
VDKKTLTKAGIDIKVFGAHSTRSASTSAAKVGNMTISAIMDAAWWSNTKTFSKFYDKPIESDQKENFGDSLLKIVNVDFKHASLIKHARTQPTVLPSPTALQRVLNINDHFHSL